MFKSNKKKFIKINNKGKIMFFWGFMFFFSLIAWCYADAWEKKIG